MTSHSHQIFAALPATGSLAANVARTLAIGHRELAGAGYGAAVLGPVGGGGVHVDETICGRAAAGLDGFFAQAAARARAFAARLNGPVTRLVVPVLPYDLYFPSLWRHQAARRAMPDFASLAAQLGADPRGWVDLVEELVAALAPQEVVILPAPLRAAQVLAALVPAAGLAAQDTPPAAMPDTALAMLQRLYRSGVRISPRQAARLAEVHARQPQPAPLASFAPLEAARLRQRFGADIDRLAGLPGVRIGLAAGLACAAE